MKKLLPKLALALLPVALYLAVFVTFEPNNYFGLRKNANGNSPIARVRAYEETPHSAIILGDSRMAHFDMELVTKAAGRPFSNVAYGGASLEETVDEFYYLIAQNANIDTVVLGLSFYTLNASYRPANRMKTIETQLKNPAAYVFNLEYNINMLTALSDRLARRPDLEETAEHTPFEYVDAQGNPLPFRQNLMDYAAILYPVCENFSINEPALEKLLQLADFCAEQGISLTFVLPPMDESVRSLVCKPLGIDAAMRPALAALHASGAQVLDYEWENAPETTDTQFYDGFHLDTKHGLPQWTQTLFSEVL